MESDDQKRIVLAIVLSGIVLLFWQTHFTPIQETPVSDHAPPGRREIRETPTLLEDSRSKRIKGRKEKAPVLAKNILGEGGHSLVLRSDFSVEEMRNPNQINSFDKITGKNPFNIQIIRGGEILDLALTLEASKVRGGIRGSDPHLGIQFKGHFDHLGRFHFSLQGQGPYRYRLLYKSTPDDLGNNRIRQYLIQTQNMNRFEVGDVEFADGNIRFLGIDHHYHLFAFVPQIPTVAQYKSHTNGTLIVDFMNTTNNFEGFLVYTKKNYDHLVSLVRQLESSVDFGFFSILAIPILRGLQFFYSFFPNYGIAIILLTILIRLITFPLQFKSFKSMKKMQVIQPELQKLREKYSEDKARMQQETMNLFKKAGANPLGGCFPLLLQMPIFFAFYQVLHSAVELLEAPFYFWILDLSKKDPYYVLPVLMGVAMFAQTKLNPSPTADKMQRNIMLLMPVIFAFIMKDFSSGLNLYILFSTLFGIAQQLIVYKIID